MIWGALAALAAGLCFAVGGVLQQRVAATRPNDESLSPRLIFELARRPMWLAGLGVAVLSYVFQALALSQAPVSLVQPLLVTELLFAIPVAVRLRGARLRLRDWAGVLCVAGGLAAAIVAADPQPGDPLAPVTEWTPVFAAVLAVVVTAVFVGRKATRGTARASMYALAAAAAMATEAGLMSATTKIFERGAVAGFTAWQPYAMAASSIVGLVLVQSSFQAGPLAASLPVADTVEPLGAIAIGLALFDERIRTSIPHLTVAATGLAALLVGILTLDTSPVIRRLHEQQTEERDDARPREVAGHTSA